MGNKTVSEDILHKTYSITTMEKKKLYAVYLGGKTAGKRFGEDHELVFTVAENMEQAKRQARLKWGEAIARTVHVDDAKLIGKVDGYRVKLEKIEE